VDKPVVLTGASGGIGVALTDYLLSRGFTSLALQYHSHLEPLLPVLEKYKLDPERVCFKADLTNEVEVRKFAQDVKERFHCLWGLINLAGASSNGMSWKLSFADFKKIVDANLTGTFLACREFIPMMREGGGGRIINTSSVVGATGVVGASHYCAAKSGIMGFTKAVALELASKNVTVNTLALGYFEYGMLYTIPENLRNDIKARIPVARFGQAREIGGLIEYLMGENGGYMTGQVLHLNGGMHG
jgi:3-oxoacyl-[acyl-carrier protein] reductase